MRGLTGLAVINVGFTVASGEAWFAAAAVTAHGVLAGCSIETRILHTLFDVHLTRLALERRGSSIYTLSLNCTTTQVYTGSKITLH